MEITHLNSMPLVAEPMQDGIYKIQGVYWKCKDDYLRTCYQYEVDQIDEFFGTTSRPQIHDNNHAVYC